MVRQTEKTLAAAGRNGHEVFVFWSGRQDRQSFVIERGHVPLQTAYKTPEGLLVEVMGDELHKLNAWLYSAQQVLAVQIHCHPQEAYHSETDDQFPIITALGGASVVVPDFCRHGLLGGGTAVYRLSETGWTRSSEDAADIILVG